MTAFSEYGTGTVSNKKTDNNKSFGAWSNVAAGTKRQPRNARIPVKVPVPLNKYILPVRVALPSLQRAAPVCNSLR